jgi:hypothetical protein
MHKLTPLRSDSTKLGKQRGNLTEHLADGLAQLAEFGLTLTWSNRGSLDKIPEPFQPDKKLSLIKRQVHCYRPVCAAEDEIRGKGREKLVVGRAGP